MKLSFAFVLLSLVLGLVYAAPTNPADPLNTNCFSLTYPVNGTIWHAPGSYVVTWTTYGTCEGVYNAYLIPATVNANGEYILGELSMAMNSVDLSLGLTEITLNLDEPAGKYVFTIAQQTGENLDYTDLAIIDIV
ncbi:hypothetical protein CLU79DRAFT_837306 [Phycomyces nitens]|nr:hypothetical protein CLU79DRAFT_837306 [Phycomyces nitens]